MLRRLVFALLLITLMSVSLAAQTPNSKPAATPNAVPVKPETASVAVKAEDLVKLQKMQTDFLRLVLAMERMQRDFDNAKTQRDALDQQMTAWVAQQAQALKIDLTAYEFDPVGLEFKPKKAAAPSKPSN